MTCNERAQPCHLCPNFPLICSQSERMVVMSAPPRAQPTVIKGPVTSAPEKNL